METLSAYEIYKKAMEAVEENNTWNKGLWLDWENGITILDIYGLPKNTLVEDLLNIVVWSDNQGDISYTFLKYLEFQEYGINFSDSTSRYKNWEQKQQK